MKKPKIALVPFSEIAKSPGMRLDPGYYLGTEVDRNAGKARRNLVHVIKRLFRTHKALISMRWRVFRWRVEGRIKYK